MKKIGILTYFASINYGAFLQAYSLVSFLQERYEGRAYVEIIGYDSPKSHTRYSNWRYLKEARKYVNFLECWKEPKFTERFLISDEMEKIGEFIASQHYDIVVVGSDEVWRTDGWRGFPNAYWLNFDIGDAERVSYAVSGRNDYSLMNKLDQEYLASALNKFEYIGVRDHITERELSNITRKKINYNCDPCFLWARRYQEMSAKETVWNKYDVRVGKRVLVMLQNHFLAMEVYKKLSEDNFVINSGIMNEDYTDVYTFEANPFEWNAMISSVDFIITDYFHCTVFSILHSVPFIALEGADKGRGKIENLLIEHELKDRMIYKNEFDDDISRICESVADLFMKLADISEIGYSEIINREQRKAESFFGYMDDRIKGYQAKGLQ